MVESNVSFTEKLYEICQTGTVNKVEEMLLSSNVEVYTYEECLVNAVRGENASVIEYFIKHYPPKDYTPSAIAAAEGENISLVMKFVRLGANINEIVPYTTDYEILSKILHPHTPIDNLIISLELSVKRGNIS